MSAITPRDVLARGAALLAQAGIDTARLDARLLLAHAMGVPGDAPVSIGAVAPQQCEAFEALIARRASREPLAYITGMKEFWSLDFEVGPGVLVPRPETETLLEEGLRAFADRSAALEVLDLGTGSACLLIAALRSFPHARGEGVDVSVEALAWARRNVARHHLSLRCELRQGSWNDGAQRGFDAIFANPPYLSDRELAAAPLEISRYEPRLAFAAGEDGLDCYRSLAPAISRYLAPGGRAFLEIGRGQAGAVTGIFGSEGLEVSRIAPDLSGIPRCIVVGRRA
jgi:release factor glutamine methyltransferase